METNNKKLKFAMLFSGGKDSTIALGKMIRAGHIPVCIVVGKMTDGLTHMHLLRDSFMDRYSDALNLPLFEVVMKSKYDFAAWDRAIKELIKEYHIDAVCNGDIAFEYSMNNLKRLAEDNGLKMFAPLWGVNEENIIKELSDYKVIVKSIERKIGLDDIVGQELSDEIINRLHEKGIQLSSGTPEMHTIAVDGPVFSHPIEFMIKDIIKTERIVIADII